MSNYIPNRSCSCARCRTQGLMGAVILITLGVLFLLQGYLGIYFHQTWPALLIVIGVMIYAGRSAPTEGHVQPYAAQNGAPTASDRGPDQPGPEVHS